MVIGAAYNQVEQMPDSYFKKIQAALDKARKALIKAPQNQEQPRADIEQRRQSLADSNPSNPDAILTLLNEVDIAEWNTNQLSEQDRA